MKQVAVTYRHASRIKKEDYIFQAWLNTVQFANYSTVGFIYKEWKKDKVRLMLDENDYYNAIDNN